MPAGLFIEYLNLSGFAQFHSRKFSWKARFVESAVYSDVLFLHNYIAVRLMTSTF